MRIAVLADIHGNKYAMQSVVEDISQNDIDEVIFLGDLVINGLYPKECLYLLHKLNPTVLVKGNTDGWFDELDENWVNLENIENRIYSRYKFVNSHLAKEEINQIKNFQNYKIINRESVKILCCHGTPRSYSEMIFENIGDEELREIFKGFDENVVLVGHTHRRMDINRLGKRIINPGAIGYSFDGDTRAGYGILDISNGKLAYEQRNIEYDRDKYIHDLNNSNTVFAENVIELVSKGAPLTFK